MQPVKQQLKKKLICKCSADINYEISQGVLLSTIHININNIYSNIMIIAITIQNVFKPRVTIIIMTVITQVYQLWL